MKIYARNLRGVQLKSLCIPDEDCILVADNGTGKSTMSLVPYWVLTGKGLKVKDGESLCEGAVDFGNGITISRQVDHSKSKTTILFNGAKVTEKTMKEELARRNLSISVLEKFYMPITQIDNDSILAAAGMNLSVNSILNSFTVGKEQIKSYFDSLGITTVTVPNITKCEKFFNDKRKEIRKDIKAAETVITDIGDVPDESALNAQIENCLSRITDLTQKSVKAHSELDMIDAASNIKKNIESQQAKLASLEAENVPVDFKSELAGLNKKKAEYVQTISEKKKALSTIEGEIKQKNISHLSLSKEVSKIKEQIKSKSNSINVIENTKSCPLYAGIACSTDKSMVVSVLKNEISELQESEKDINDNINKSVSSIAYLHQRQAEIKNEIDHAEKSKADIDKAINSIENDLKLISVRKERLNDLKAQITESKQAYSKINIPDNEETIVESASMADAEILNEKQQLSSLQSLLQASIRKVQLEESVKEKIKERSELDEIIKEIKELPGMIFKKIIAPLEATANKVLESLSPDWKIKINKDGSVIVQKQNAAIPLEELSTGEKIILNYCMKNVIAQLIGFDNIIIDDCDVLDEKAMNKLLSAMQKSSIHTMIIAARKLIVSGIKEINL